MSPKALSLKGRGLGEGIKALISGSAHRALSPAYP